MLLADMLTAESKVILDGFGPKFDVTNVAEYYAHHPKESWKIGEDFPRCIPPFERMWVEYRFPRTVWSKVAGRHTVPAYDSGFVPYFGFFVGRNFSIRRETTRSGNPALNIKVGPVADNGEWLIHGGLYLTRGNVVERYVDEVSVRFDIDPNKDTIDEWYISRDWEGLSDEEAATRLYAIHPVLMAFSLCNCRNVELVNVQHDAALQKARQKRGKAPLYSFKTIDILPIGRTVRRNRTESSDTHVAAHIRRGNFAKYGEQYGRKKLFGKLDGMYWRPQSAVGNMQYGESGHDYNVKVKK